MQAIDPATEEIIAEYPDHDAAQVDALLARAGEAYRQWRTTSFAERATLLVQAAEILTARRDRYALLMTCEMGKTIAAARAEVDKCALACRHFAERAEHYLAPEPIASDAASSYVRYDPIGAVLAVMPWNFPFWQVFRFAAPGLMAGNVGLLKHASNVPGCALAIEEVFHDAGFPEGAFTTLMIGSSLVPQVIGNPVVQAVTLTGSEAAGGAVASEAGRQLKKCVLELGGSDPFIVLADADIEATAAQAVVARTQNNGQTCIAAKRFIVEAPVFDQFEMELTRRTAQLVVGDPKEPGTDVGPLARPEFMDELHDQVQRSVAAGAIRILGGQRKPQRGYYYEPTVLTAVKPGMAAFDEETFGPVAALVRADNVDHAIELANQSSFGLAASVWTGDAPAAEQLVSGIEAGAVFVNGMVKSDPRLPFGGIKRSGFGRELAAPGIREFVNTKTVWIAG